MYYQGRRRRSRRRSSNVVSFVTKDGRKVSFRKKRKSRTRKGSVPPALKKWRLAAQEHGYMIPGEYRKMPKRGTAAHAKITRTYRKMLGGR